MSLTIVLIPKGRNAVELVITSYIFSPNSIDPIFRFISRFKERDNIIREVLSKIVKNHLDDIIAYNRNAQVISIAHEPEIQPTTSNSINLFSLIQRLFDIGSYSLKVKAPFEAIKGEFDAFTNLMKVLMLDFEGKLRTELLKLIKPLKSVELTVCPLNHGKCLLGECVFFDLVKGCLLVNYLNF